MKGLLAGLIGAWSGRTRPERSPARVGQLRPGLEALEGRDTPSTVTVDGSEIRIQGTDAADTVRLEYDDRGSGWYPYDDQVKVFQNNSTVPTNTIPHWQWYGALTRVHFNGGGGNDTFTNNTHISATANGEGGSDILFGGSSDDFLFGGMGDDFLVGRDGNDRLMGGLGSEYWNSDLDRGNDRLEGGRGDDILYGNGGHDTLLGDGGTDYLNGCEGDDFLDGGRDGCADTLVGGAGWLRGLPDGRDTFVQYTYLQPVLWWWEHRSEDVIADQGSGDVVVVRG